MNETFSVTSVDGTPSSVKITINGTNDAATVSSADVALGETNAPLTTSGTLTSTDVDNPNNTFTASSVTGAIGTFAIDAAGAWTFTANSAFNSLNVGQNVNETFSVTSVDGTTSSVKITINGTNDAATVTIPTITPPAPLPDPVPLTAPTPLPPVTLAPPIAEQPAPPVATRPVDPILSSQPVNIAGGLGGGAPATAPAPAAGPAPGGDAAAAAAANAINNLAAPAAGPTPSTPTPAPVVEGFQVARITTTENPARAAELASITSGRLFVLEGVPDIQAEGQFVLPSEAFAHTDNGAVVRLEARQSNGDPLPAWLSFNNANGTFSGTPPEGKPTPIEVQVVARDNQAREASVIFKLEMGVTAPAGATTAASGAILDSIDRGFPVARVGSDSSADAQSRAGEARASGGDRLFVLEGVKNAVGDQRYQLPQEAFAHTDAKAVVKLEARQANGEPLPSWIEFDPVSGLFRGTPPDGRPISLELVVIARDNAAREASVVFTLEMGVAGADAPASAPARGTTGTGTTGSGPARPEAGLPADSTVPAPSGASLGGQDALKTVQQGASSGALGTNTASDRGFPVARVSAESLVRVTGADGQVTSEQRLFVYQGVLTARGDTQYQVPATAFGHTDPSAIVRLEARTADGGALPSWLRFDSVLGIFRGTPPNGQRTLLEIVLTARDEEGREANLTFTLELGVRADGEPAQADAPAVVVEPRAMADVEEADEEEAVEVAQVDGDAPVQKGKAEKGKPVRAGAVPFGEQIRAAKVSRDPLLAKILGGDKPAPQRPAGRTNL